MQILLKSTGSVENVYNYIPSKDGKTVTLELKNQTANDHPIKIVKDWEVEVLD